MGKTNWPGIMPAPGGIVWATPIEIATARRAIIEEDLHFGNGCDTGDLVVDRNAITSRADTGLWVSAWVWINHTELSRDGLPLIDADNDDIEEPVA